MKAIFLTENLQKRLPFLNHAVSGRSTLPILSNLLLEAKNGKLKVTSTDLEIGIISHIPANIEEEGVVTIPAKTFSDLIGNLGEGKISLENKGTNIELRGKNVDSLFQTMSPEEFPQVYQHKGRKIGTLKKQIVEEEFSKVVFAASQDTGRPALSGVLLEKAKDGLSLVATDGYRLSLKKKLNVDLKDEEDKTKMLIPSRVIRELINLKEDGEIDVFVSKESNQIIFQQGDVVLVGRLIEAEYPSYEKILPADFSTFSEFDRGQLLNAVKICSVFARDTANIVKFSIKRSKIVVSANTPSVGENTVDVEAKTEGEENEIAFNARYLLDVLSIVEKNDMVFEMTGPLNPGVFRIKDDPTFLHLIMPIRVQG